MTGRLDVTRGGGGFVIAGRASIVPPVAYWREGEQQDGPSPGLARAGGRLAVMRPRPRPEGLTRCGRFWGWGIEGQFAKNAMMVPGGKSARGTQVRDRDDQPE